MRLPRNKSVLQRERAKAALYRRALPALKLKREELLRRKLRAEAELKAFLERAEENARLVMRELVMLANEHVPLSGLVRLGKVTIAQENVLGVSLPVLAEVEIQVAEYSPLARPHWVDGLVALLGEALELEIARQVAARRLAILQQAERSATQRVNLFEKVLLPRALSAVQRLKVDLEDLERAEIVRAKVAKGKR